MSGPRLDEVAAHPEVDDQRREDEKMSAEAHVRSVQERITVDDASTSITPDTYDAALDALAPHEVEETAGELHRRIAAALRDIGERRADRGGRNSPRAKVASLAVMTELAAATLGAAAAGSSAQLPRLDVHPSMVAAVMYAAPTIQALLLRLEQDRRLVASLARTLESRLDEECASPWSEMTLRRLVTSVTVVHPARIAMELDTVAGEADA
jgi:hypothetical protein